MLGKAKQKQKKKKKRKRDNFLDNWYKPCDVLNNMSTFQCFIFAVSVLVLGTGKDSVFQLLEILRLLYREEM